MMTERGILIAGAGALGSVLGAALQAQGHAVTLVGRRTHLEAIARHGLRLSGIFGEKIATGFSLAENLTSLRSRFGLVLVTVKSYDTGTIARGLSEVVDPDGIVVSLQNGLGNVETLANHLGPQRVLGARVIFGAEMPAPGAAHVTVIAEPVAVGPARSIQGACGDRLLERAKEVAKIFSNAGVPTEAVADVMPVLWTKLFYNAALNPLGALLKTHYGAVGEDMELRGIMDQTIKEAFAVARRLEVPLKFRDAAEYLAHFYGRLLPPTYHHRPTMLRDLERRGRTEIEALNGKIVELAESVGLDAPTNRMLVALIRASERIRQAETRNEQDK